MSDTIIEEAAALPAWAEPNEKGEWPEDALDRKYAPRCVLWRRENLANYLKKGKQIYVSGRLQTRDYEDNAGVKRYVTEIVCEDVILLGGGTGAQPPHAASAPGGEGDRGRAGSYG